MRDLAAPRLLKTTSFMTVASPRNSAILELKLDYRTVCSCFVQAIHAYGQRVPTSPSGMGERP
jgi:hypothetical protein